MFESNISPLSKPHKRVLELLAKGLSNKQIASEIQRSIKTVETHRAAIMTRTGSRTFADLLRMYFLNQLPPICLQRFRPDTPIELSTLHAVSACEDASPPSQV